MYELDDRCVCCLLTFAFQSQFGPFPISALHRPAASGRSEVVGAAVINFLPIAEPLFAGEFLV